RRNSSDTSAIEVHGLSKTFGDHTAVSNVSFSEPQGATRGLVGESGPGNTTTVRLNLGLERPDTGNDRIFGQHFAPAKESDRSDLRDRLGAISQVRVASFDPRYTTSQILTNALSQGTTSRARRYHKPALELLDLVELDSSLLARSPRELSGGQ